MSENSADKGATAGAAGKTSSNNVAVNDAGKTTLEQLVVKQPTACGLNITERAQEKNNIMLEGARLGIQAAIW